MALPRHVRCLAAAIVGLLVGGTSIKMPVAFHFLESPDDVAGLVQIVTHPRHGGEIQAVAEAAKENPAKVANIGCDLMVLTTFLSTKKDWQRERYRVPTFEKMRDFYESAIEQGLNVTVLYDELPEEVLSHETEHFKFQHVDIAQYDTEEGVNDVRFNLAKDVVQQRPEWNNVFLVDLFDVKVGMNPCGQMEDGRLYVGDTGMHLKNYAWMEKRFVDMGGKYEAWFRNSVQPSWLVLNAGISGGRRDVFLQFLEKMTEVLADPELSARKRDREENVNMGALNYVVRVSMNLTDDADVGKPGFSSGLPVHSNFRKFETDRKDVWFIHK